MRKDELGDPSADSKKQIDTGYELRPSGMFSQTTRYSASESHPEATKRGDAGGPGRQDPPRRWRAPKRRHSDSEPRDVVASRKGARVPAFGTQAQQVGVPGRTWKHLPYGHRRYLLETPTYRSQVADTSGRHLSVRWSSSAHLGGDPELVPSQLRQVLRRKSRQRTSADLNVLGYSEWG